MTNDDHIRLRLLEDHVQRMQQQLDEIQKTQKEAITLVNRYVGGLAFLIGAGVFVGWLTTMSSSSLILQWFNK